MNVLTTTERKALFPLTRVLVLLVIILLGVGICGGTFYATLGGKSIPSGRVLAAAVFTEGDSPLPTANGLEAREENPLGNLRLPLNAEFQEYMKMPTIKAIIEKKVLAIEKGERQAFLDEMGRIITRATAEGKVPDMYLDRFFNLSTEAIAERKMAEAAKRAEQERAAYGIVAGLGLVALFSLVLVLLAIERNTRPTSPGE